MADRGDFVVLLVAGLLFAAAATVPGDVARRLSSEEWADLVDAEVVLYYVSLRAPSPDWTDGGGP